MSYQLLHTIDFTPGINASAPMLSANSQNSLSSGSWNAITSGDGFTRGFSGTTAQIANSGSRKMMPVGKTYGGIKDIGSVNGSGSFFEDIGKSRWGIGAGQPHIEGINIAGFVLSTLLQVSVAVNGIYTAPVQAGLGQPSAPEIGILHTVGDVSNSISAKLERRRPSTGAKGLASPTSAVIFPQGNRVRVTFPLASAGQTHWRVFFTFQGFGGNGIHYLCKYGDLSDIPETLVAAGTVDGIARSLEFNYKDGDLVPLEASYDDYAPPAATHAIRLESVVNLAGCYPDSSAAPTSGNPGTVISVSKINNYESHVPTHLLYLPEPVTDTLARSVDDFGYVACENSVHAIQFVGYRGDELPPCTITTVLPDIGVQYPHNWTHFRGRLLIYTAEGNLIMMTESGEFDTTFAAPIQRIIKDWTTAQTIVGYDPKNDCLIVANGKRILVFSLSRGEWRQIWLPDFNVFGNVLSCTTAKRRLYISVNNGGVITAHTFDTGNQNAPLSFATNYINAPTGNAGVKDIFEAALAVETGTASPLVLAINKNLLKTSFRQISVNAGSNLITDLENSLLPKMLHKKCVIFADGIAGAGTVFIQGKISNISGNTFRLVDANNNPVTIQITKTDLLMFVGSYLVTRSVDQSSELPNFFPNTPECRSYQVAVWFKGNRESGNALSCDLFGNSYSSSRAS